MNDDIVIGSAFTFGLLLMVGAIFAKEFGANSVVVGWLGAVGFIALFGAVLMAETRRH